MVAAFLIGASLVAVAEYAANARMRAGVETASSAAQAANAALGQVRAELAALGTGFDQQGRRGGDTASLHAVRGELAVLQRRLDEVESAQAGAVAKLGQRLDAGDSQRAETSQKLAEFADGVAQLEQRVAAIASDQRVAAQSSAAKQNERPPSIDGWRVVNMAGQRAVVRNPNGRLYEVASGSEVPGLGIIENVRRIGKRVTVVTPRGEISAILDSNQ